MHPSTLETLAERLGGFISLTDERFKNTAEALKLQAKEYERRLEALNGEASRLAASDARHVSSEKFELKISELERRMDEMALARAGIEGRAWGIAIAMGGVVTLMNLTLHFIRR